MNATAAGLRRVAFRARTGSAGEVLAHGALLMLVALASLIVAAAPAAAAPRRDPVLRVTQHFASAPRTCAVLQSAYIAARRGTTSIYPDDVRSGPRGLDLDRIVPEYRAGLALSAREFDDLATQGRRYANPNFRPACRWAGVPGPSIDDEGHATFVIFSSPVFSTAGRLAMVEISFHERGTFGYGLMCVVRHGRGGWKGTCRTSWIT